MKRRILLGAVAVLAALAGINGVAQAAPSSAHAGYNHGAHSHSGFRVNTPNFSFNFGGSGSAHRGHRHKTRYESGYGNSHRGHGPGYGGYSGGHAGHGHGQYGGYDGQCW